MAIRVTVRPVSASELPLVERQLPAVYPSAHASRLADQRAGLAVFLVAWLGERPVGHAVVRWRGAANAQLRALTAGLPVHPYVEALYVQEGLRSQSIGSQILEVAEAAAHARGYGAIGLAVGVENVRARELYDRLGYRDVGLERFQNRWSFVRRDGRVGAEVEICVYLVKNLERVGPALPADTPDTPAAERAGTGEGQ